MKINSKNNSLRLALTIALSFALADASAASLDVSSNSKNYNDWTFTVGAHTFDHNLIYVAPGINGVPPDSTYNGNNLISDNAYKGFWTATLIFYSPSNQSGEVNIDLFAADDRAQLLLNGIPIMYAGLFAPGPGFFQTADGSLIPYNYTVEESGKYDYGNSNTTGFNFQDFKQGENILQVNINNTFDGIYGQSLTRDDPTHFTLQGSIVASGALTIPQRVSEPPTIFLTLAGFFTLLMCKCKRRMSSRFSKLL
jgi:hypothetical protein